MNFLSQNKSSTSHDSSPQVRLNSHVHEFIPTLTEEKKAETSANSSHAINKSGFILSSSDNGTELIRWDPPQVEKSLFGSAQLRQAFASMFHSNKRYRLRLIRTADLVTSGAGIMNLATGIAPSNFDQYTQLSLLFRECQLVRTMIVYASYIRPGDITTIPVVFASGFDPVNASSSPSSSFTTTLRLQNSKQYDSQQTNWPVRNHYTSNIKSTWSLVTGSGSGTDPMGAMSGVWFHNINGAGSNSKTYLHYTIYADYDFRNLI